MLEQITNFLVSLLQSTGLAGIFIITILESLFAPLPSEVVLVYAGFYVKSTGGVPELFLMALIASAGNFVGTLPFYLATRYSSEKYLDKFLAKWGKFLLISREDITKVENFFKSKGRITIFLAKLIPGMRSLIAIPAGLSKIDFKVYAALSLAGSFIWSLFLGSIGYLSYDQRDKIFAILKPIENIVLGILFLLVLFYIVKVYLNFKKISSENTPKPL